MIRAVVDQLSIFSENTAYKKQLLIPETRKHQGRNALPVHLPVREVIIELKKLH